MGTELNKNPDLLAVIGYYRTELSQREVALTELRQRTQALESEIGELSDGLRGLEAAAARLGLTPPAGNGGSTPAEPTAQASVQELTRTDAVLHVLRASNGPKAPRDVRDELHRIGRDDSLPHVSAALAYLKRTGRALTTGHAAWEATARDKSE